MKSKELKIALTSAATIVALGGCSILGYTHRQSSHAAPGHSIEHTGVITTVFWAGEHGDADNGDIANTASAWDEHWQQHFGGVDTPEHRNGYNPAGFAPKENPFYVALPYNDIDNNGNRKPTAGYCRAWQPYPDARYSYCKNIWVEVTHEGQVAYAQLEDAGPFGENDTAYVFGSAAPANTQGEHAGLDVSPAVRDDLHLGDVSTTTWRFVKASDVPAGPWKKTVTTNPGESL